MISTKRGQEVDPPSVSAGLIIALIVGFLLIQGVIYAFEDRINPAAELIPTPNLNIGGAGGSAPNIIMYDLSNDKVQWYDGTKFNEFPNEKTFGEMKISPSIALKQFQSYYRNGERDTLATAQFFKISSTNNGCLDFFNIGSTNCGFPDSGKGSVLIKMNKGNCDSLVLGFDNKKYCINSNGKSYSYSEMDSAISQDIISIFDIAKTWRDSVLKKPITIPYVDAVDKNQQKTKKFCIEKIDAIRLVVDLDKPLGDDVKTCPGVK